MQVYTSLDEDRDKMAATEGTKLPDLQNHNKVERKINFALVLVSVLALALVIFCFNAFSQKNAVPAAVNTKDYSVGNAAQGEALMNGRQ